MRAAQKKYVSQYLRKIIYITGMVIFHLKYRIYLNWETAEIYEALTVPWPKAAG